MSSSTKQFLIIVGAILVAAAIIGGAIAVKNAWDSHQAAVAQAQAQIQEEQQQTQEAAREAKAQQEAAKQAQITSLQDLINKIGPAGSQKFTRPDGTIEYNEGNLRGKLEEAQGIAQEQINWWASENCPISQCDPQRQVSDEAAITQTQNDLQKAINDYNTKAAQVDPGLLKQNGLPPKLDSNGDPIPQDQKTDASNSSSSSGSGLLGVPTLTDTEATHNP